MASEKHDPWALLAAARGSVLQHKKRLLDCDHEDDCTCDLAAQKIVLLSRIDAALAAQDIKPSPADIKWEEKDSNRHGISPHEADYSDDVFLTVEKHWLCGQWLFRVEYVAYAASKDEAKAKAVEYAGRLP